MIHRFNILFIMHLYMVPYVLLIGAFISKYIIIFVFYLFIIYQLFHRNKIKNKQFQRNRYMYN